MKGVNRLDREQQQQQEQSAPRSIVMRLMDVNLTDGQAIGVTALFCLSSGASSPSERSYRFEHSIPRNLPSGGNDSWYTYPRYNDLSIAHGI